jgi:hypothetical protein
MQLPGVCHAVAMPNCHACAMHLPRSSQCNCRAVAMRLPCSCHAFAMCVVHVCLLLSLLFSTNVFNYHMKRHEAPAGANISPCNKTRVAAGHALTTMARSPGMPRVEAAASTTHQTHSNLFKLFKHSAAECYKNTIYGA